MWACRHIKQVDNRNFNIKQAPYLKDIFQDENPSVTVQKSSQTRLTVTMIIRFLYRVAVRGWNGIYYFPTDDALYPFVQERLNRLITDNEDLSAVVRDTDNTVIKRMGNAFARFFGLKSKMKKKSTPADHECFDEVDEMAEKDVDIALQRMEASPIKAADYISTPSLPGMGINRKYEDSDQKHWAMKCPHCSTWNIEDLEDEMEFPKCIEPGYLACKKCGKALDVLLGHWVPKVTANKNSGYHVSRLFAWGVDYRRILEQFKKTLDLGDFYNHVLGMPYADVNTRITQAQVLALCGGNYMGTGSLVPCTAGVDVGHTYLDVMISRPSTVRIREYVYIGRLEGRDRALWSQLRHLFKKFDVKRYMLDGEPETQSCQDFIHDYRRDGWMADYNSHETKKPPHWDDNARLCKMDRTGSLDASHRILRDALIDIPRRCEAVETFALHCANLQRKRIVDPKDGTVSYSWVHAEGAPDHLRHAFNYDVVLWYQGQTLPAAAAGISVPKKVRQLIGQED